jgi:hypothetical protein
MWDPIGLKDSDCPRDEYDTYLLHVSGWLKAGRQREEAVAYLVDIERRHMGLTGRTTAEECARQTVERIAALVRTKAVARARLLVVLDPAFGQRLQGLPPGRPAWIVMSPDNEPAIRTYWQAYPDLGHLNGVSGITPCSGASPEEELLANLDTIDLHHGPYSSASPYEELEVIGAHLSPAIETELATLGFTEFDDTAEGFLAHRTAEQASVRRD